MQKWEYLHILFDHVGSLVELSHNNVYALYLQPRFINGVENKNWKKEPLMFDYLNRLGNDGWELVELAGYRAMFKRPKL